MKEQSGYLSRRKNFTLILLIVGGCLNHAFAQINPFAIGARSWGIANATVASRDQYSIFSNVAGLGGNRDAYALSSYDSHYGFEGLSTIGIAGVIPVSGELSSGFSIQRFGDKLYNETSLGIGAGHRIDRFSLGIKANYLQTAINAPNLAFNKRTFVLELGGIVHLTDHFFLGAHLYNLTQSRYSGAYGDKVPTSIRTGFLFLPIKALRISTEVEKNTNLPVSIRAGMAYQLWEKLWLRTGISAKPLTHSFGAGFNVRNFSIDYAVHSNPELGWSHHFSLAYVFWKVGETE